MAYTALKRTLKLCRKFGFPVTRKADYTRVEYGISNETMVYFSTRMCLYWATQYGVYLPDDEMREVVFENVVNTLDRFRKKGLDVSKEPTGRLVLFTKWTAKYTWQKWWSNNKSLIRGESYDPFKQMREKEETKWMAKIHGYVNPPYATNVIVPERLLTGLDAYVNRPIKIEGGRKRDIQANHKRKMRLRDDVQCFIYSILYEQESVGDVIPKIKPTRQGQHVAAQRVKFWLRSYFNLDNVNEVAVKR